MTCTKFNKITHHYHPDTNELIISVVYESKINSGIHGAVIGTKAELITVPIFKDWNLKYISRAVPRDFEIYKENNFFICWGQERKPFDKDIVSAKMPEVNHFISWEEANVY